jgi:adenosylhomocysteine nucleosidase
VSAAGHSATIAVITGLRAEVRCLRGLDVCVACSGGSAERARDQAARLVAEGAVGLVSFGLAGGLAPQLRAGHLLLPEAVRSAGLASWSVDPMWRERVRTRFAAGGTDPAPGAVVGTDRIVATASDKRALFEATGAQAVDMESHEVAAIASGAGLPFLVVRALADPHDQVIPQIAREALMPDGRVRLQATLGGLIRQPGELMALLRLGVQSARGLASLRRAAALAAPRFAFASRGVIRAGGGPSRERGRATPRGCARGAAYGAGAIGPRLR